MKSPQVKITPELVIEMVFRRRWLIILPLAAALVVGIHLALTMPRVYEASTLILVERQRVPEAYVRPIVTADLSERITTISQQILSRSNLEKIISDFGLFSGPSHEGAFMEDKIAALRNRITVEVSRDRRRSAGDSFTLSFQGRDPELVTRVTNGLAASFIDANLLERETQALGTSDFLDTEMEAMRTRLEELEKVIENFRRTHMGELPEQLDTNLRIMDRLQNTLNTRQQNLREARIRLNELTSQASATAPSVVVIGGERGIDRGTASLQELKSELDSLRTRYTERHPDIQRMVRLIADLEAREAERARAAGDTPSVPVERMAQARELRREIETYERDIADLQDQLALYQRRVENTPRREQELLTLRRDYQNIQSSYNSLLARKIEADIAVNLERKQKGEQFRIVDPAQVPERPIAPDMQKLFLISVALGLGIGGGLAFLFEFVLKPPFRRAEDLETAFGLPVISSIPRILRRRHIVLKWVENGAAIVFCVITVGLLALFGMIALKGTEPVAELLKIIAGNYYLVSLV
jgi:polysaccharide chain length determinant protein (PEP-CTERM system associated)